jgi:hypothetical protein
LTKISGVKISLKGVSLGGASCWEVDCFGGSPKGRRQGRQIWQGALQLARIEGHTS